MNECSENVAVSTDAKLCPDCDEPSLSKADGVLQCHNCGWSEPDEPPEPDGECYRGNEYAASVAHEMAEARKLK